jgi:hypothetical protein
MESQVVAIFPGNNGNVHMRKHDLSYGLRPSLEEKPLFTTGVYDCFLVERDILQLIV